MQPLPTHIGVADSHTEQLPPAARLWQNYLQLKALEFKTCHEDADNTAMVATTLQHPISFFGEGWKR